MKKLRKIPRLKPKTLYRTLPLATFELVYQLLQQVAELPGAIWLGDDNFLAFQNGGEMPSEIGEYLVAKIIASEMRSRPNTESVNHLQISTS